MRYKADRTIARPVDEVRQLFSDIDRLQDWQPALLKAVPIDGERDRPGARMRLIYVVGRHRIEMTETLESGEDQTDFAAVYQTEQAWNRMTCAFSETEDGQTHWHLENELRCRGRMRVMSILSPGALRRQTDQMMDAFQRYAEAA